MTATLPNISLHYVDLSSWLKEFWVANTELGYESVGESISSATIHPFFPSIKGRIEAHHHYCDWKDAELKSHLNGVWTSSLVGCEHQRHHNRVKKEAPTLVILPFSSINSKVLCPSILPFRYLSGSSQFFIINHPMLLCHKIMSGGNPMSFFYLSTSVIEPVPILYLARIMFICHAISRFIIRDNRLRTFHAHTNFKIYIYFTSMDEIFVLFQQNIIQLILWCPFSTECGQCRVNSKKLSSNKFCKRDYGEFLLIFFYSHSRKRKWLSNGIVNGEMIEGNNSFMTLVM